MPAAGDAVTPFAFGAKGDGTTDDTAAVQAAIDAATVDRLTLDLLSASFLITEELAFTCTHMAGSRVAATALKWGGAAGGTMLTRPTGISFGATWFLIENVRFTSGVNRPATFLSFDEQIDKFGRLSNLHLEKCSGDAIKINGGWVNLHWDHLRWDAVDGYAIRATTNVGQNKASFVIRDFTYDHTPGGVAPGFFYLDNAVAQAQAGLISFECGRVEMNAAWTGNKALLTDVGTPQNGAPFRLSDVTFVGLGGEHLLYRDGTQGNPSITCENVQTTGSVTPVGGLLPAQYPIIPAVGTWHLAAINGAYALVIPASSAAGVAEGLELRGSSYGGKYPLGVYRRTDANPFWRVRDNGQNEWGPGGSTAPDTTLSRSAASTLSLGADDALRTGRAATASRPSASTVGQGAQFFDTTLNKPIWSTGSAWVGADGNAV